MKPFCFLVDATETPNKNSNLSISIDQVARSTNLWLDLQQTLRLSSANRRIKNKEVSGRQNKETSEEYC